MICAQTPVERLLSSWKWGLCTSVLDGGRVVIRVFVVSVVSE